MPDVGAHGRLGVWRRTWAMASMMAWVFVIDDLDALTLLATQVLCQFHALADRAQRMLDGGDEEGIAAGPGDGHVQRQVFLDPGLSFQLRAAALAGRRIRRCPLPRGRGGDAAAPTSTHSRKA
jgi:hypothetical protein